MQELKPFFLANVCNGSPIFAFYMEVFDFHAVNSTTHVPILVDVLLSLCVAVVSKLEVRPFLFEIPVEALHSTDAHFVELIYGEAVDELTSVKLDLYRVIFPIKHDQFQLKGAKNVLFCSNCVA